jgi:hypothetical protein
MKINMEQEEKMVLSNITPTSEKLCCSTGAHSSLESNWQLELNKFYFFQCKKKEEENHVICKKVDGTGDHHVEQDKPDSERQRLRCW